MKTDEQKSDCNTKSDFGSAVQEHALGVSAPSNEVGTDMHQTSDTPRLVTRGESYETHEVIGDDGESYIIVISNGRPKLIHIPKPKIDGVSNAAIVDWLNCSFTINSDFSLDSFFGTLLPILGFSFSPAVDRGRGCYGYKKSFELGANKALFAIGGNRGTAFLSFSGDSCHQIPNWQKLVAFLSDDLNARITRVDLAYDDFEGIHTVNHALRMYQEGLFTNGGREPQMDHRGNWFKPDGRGRTLYIGSSKNGKLIRIYEKGMQLGIPFHPWVRWEVQLGNKDRDIPWETVFEAGKYLAGCYKNALDWISEEQSRIRTLQKISTVSYEALTHHASVGYGKLINTMFQVEGSAEKVVNKLIRKGIPSRLDLPSIPSHGKVLP